MPPEMPACARWPCVLACQPCCLIRRPPTPSSKACACCKRPHKAASLSKWWLIASASLERLRALRLSPRPVARCAAGGPSLLAIREEGFWQLTNASHAFAVNLLLKLAARLRANNATVSQNVQKRRQYERAAMFDGLTGIHNRRWLDETLHRMVRRHERNAGHLSLSLIDIDHFKSFNDRYGHAAGDHVLTVVATTLAANLRPTDLVARFGGEEFVIIFPDTDLEMAVRAADRVREAVAAEELAMPDGTALPRVTISMGVTQLAPGQTVPDLLKTADFAMYRAKQTGRNRVVSGRAGELAGG